MSAAEAVRLNRYQIISGHMSRSDQLKWFPERRVITVIREPIDRCLSWISYVRALTPDASPSAWAAHNLPPADFMASDDVQRNLFNRMTRQLGGQVRDEPADLPGLLENAKRTLSDAAWVGTQATLQEDLRTLALILPRFKIGRRLERKNVTPGRSHNDAIPEEILSHVRAMNHYDIELWNWAERKFGLAGQGLAAPPPRQPI
jgi:hypothetical protein